MEGTITHAAQHYPSASRPAPRQCLNTGMWAARPPAAETVRTIRPTFVHLTAARDEVPRTAWLLA